MSLWGAMAWHNDVSVIEKHSTVWYNRIHTLVPKVGWFLVCLWLLRLLLTTCRPTAEALLKIKIPQGKTRVRGSASHIGSSPRVYFSQSY